MAEDNTLTSNEIYFEKVEDEHGLELTLERIFVITSLGY